MNRIHGPGVIIVVFVVALVVAVVFGAFTNVWWGAALFLGLFVSFIFQGLNQISNQPPSKGVLTFFGERLGALTNNHEDQEQQQEEGVLPEEFSEYTEEYVLDEGWHFFPFYPFVYGAVVVDVTKQNQELDDIEARTGDLAELSFSVGLTWTPNHGSAQGLMQLLDSGGVEGVKNILADVVMERLREWAIATEDWEAALAAQDDATATLIIEIVGLDDSIDHTDLITRIRRGNGVERLETLGITINRINVKGIKVLGKLAQAAELRAKELRDRAAEAVELDHVAERIAVLVESGLSPGEASEIVQTERKKITRNVDEKKITIAPETLRAFEDSVLPLIASRLSGGGASKNLGVDNTTDDAEVTDED